MVKVNLRLPRSNTEEPEWTANTETEREYVRQASTERDRDIYSRGYNTGILARSRVNVSEPEPSSPVAPEPTTETPTATTTTSAVPTSTPAIPAPEPSPMATPEPTEELAQQPTPSPQPTADGLEITWAVRFDWGVPDGAPEWAWDYHERHDLR